MKPLDTKNSEQELTSKAMGELELLLEMQPSEQQEHLKKLFQVDPTLATLATTLLQASESYTLPFGKNATFLTEMLLPNGFEIGKYVIVKPIDAGASGTVYEVHDSSKNRFALKVMHPGFIGSHDQNRFEREIQVLHGMEHKNIPKLLDHGQVDDATQSPWLLLEHIEGASGVLEWCRLTRPDENQVIQIAMEVLSAIRYSHDQGVLHRDISPSNILVDSNGSVFVIDYGLAVLNDDARTRITGTHATLGTMRFISPEVIRDGAKAAVPASDQFAIASVMKSMYETRSFNINGPAGNVIRKACSEKISDRYSSIDQLCIDLERVLQNKKTHAEWWQNKQVIKRWVKSNPIKTASALAVCLSVIVIPSLMMLKSFEEAKVLTEVSQEFQSIFESNFRSRNKEVSLDLAIAFLKSKENILGKSHPDTISALIQVADVENDHNMPRKAEVHARDAILRLSKLDMKHCYLLADATNTLALARHNQKEYEDARQYYNTALNLAGQAGLTATDSLYIAILNNEGALLRDEEKFDEAIARFAFLKEIYIDKYGPGDSRVLGTEWYVANITRHSGNKVEAAKLYKALVQKGRKHFPVTDWRVGWWLLGSGRNMIEAGKYEEAVPLLEEAKQKLIETVGQEADWVCKADANLFIAYSALGKEVEARQYSGTKCNPEF